MADREPELRRAPPGPTRAGGGAVVFAPALAGALVPLLAYLATLHPGLAGGDSGELVTVAATGGVAHPPGYPLFVLLGGAWLHVLPFGDVAWRVNVLSALAMAAAAGVLAAVVARASGSRVAAVGAAWAFAFATPVWKYALVTEVFALNALLAAIALLVLVLAAPPPPLRASLTSPPRPPRPRRRAREPVAAPTVAETAVAAPAVAAPVAHTAAPVAAFLATLSLSHHHTLLLLAVPVFVFVFARAWRAARIAAPRARSRLVLATLAGAAVGLLPLAWLPFGARRASALAWGEAGTWRGFLALLLRSDYGTFSLAPEQSGLHADRSHVLLFAQALPRAFGWLPLALALAGAAELARRRRALGAVLGAYGVLQAAFFMRVGMPSATPWLRGVVERFYILPILVLALFAGVGAARLLAMAGGARARRRLVAGLLLAAVIALPIAEHGRRVSQRGNRFGDTLGRALLAGLPPRTVLFVQGDLVHNSLAYAQRVEGLRPDVVVLDQELMTYAWYVRRVRATHPDVLPPLGAAQRIVLRDGRALEGFASVRADGSVDVLTLDGNRTLPAAEVRAIVAAPAESLFGAARAGFRLGALAEHSDDRYSGLPGTRNLLWLDHLAGRRPVAVVGVKDDSYRLRYAWASVGLAAIAYPLGAPPPVAAQAGWALDAIAQVAPEAYFRARDPLSFEAAERWRFAALMARGALLASQPEAQAAVAAHPGGHERLLAFARRFEPLEPTPDAACLRAVGYLRLLDPHFRDLAAARRDFERYAATSEAAARDPEVRAALAGLAAGGGK